MPKLARDIIGTDRITLSYFILIKITINNKFIVDLCIILSNHTPLNFEKNVWVSCIIPNSGWINKAQTVKDTNFIQFYCLQKSWKNS